jgi:hypothetical protein
MREALQSDEGVKECSHFKSTSNGKNSACGEHTKNAWLFVLCMQIDYQSSQNKIASYLSNKEPG